MKVNFITGQLSMHLSAGVFESSRQLAINLQNHDCQLRVFGLSADLTNESYSWGGIQPEGFNAFPPRRLGYSGTYLKALLNSNADISHLQGIWMYQSAMAFKWHRRFSRPYVTTIHGMLDPWAINHSHFNKRVALMLYERTALNACTCFHATTLKEYHQIRNFGLKNPVAVIRNGICIPDLSANFQPPPWSKLVNEQQKILLYFGRVHPKKGLSNLIQAMALLKDKNPSELNKWTLVIAGCLDNGKYEKELAALISKNRLDSNVFLLGQFYHEQKMSCYYHANAFILPSFSEGMPLSALDAWAYGKYSLLTPDCNLPDGYEQGFAKKIETDPDSIAQGLRELFLMSQSELQQHGERARNYVSKEYSWQNIALRMFEMYNWAGGSAPAPSSVFFS